ncbi:MAG: hypothetical protein QXI93_00740 [Candidatus Methanomethylicia archaeon]
MNFCSFVLFKQSLEEKFRNIIYDWMQSIERNLIWLISTIKDTTIMIGRASYTSMIIIGIILWSMNIQKYLARKLIYGGIIIALLTEIIS